MCMTPLLVENISWNRHILQPSCTYLGVSVHIHLYTHLRCNNCIPWFSTVSSYKHQKLKWKINSDKLQYSSQYNCYIHWVSNFQYADSEHTQACLQLLLRFTDIITLLAGFCLSWIINLLWDLMRNIPIIPFQWTSVQSVFVDQKCCEM